MFEMDDFGASFAATGFQVLAHLPIHRGFQGVFDGNGAAFDKKVAFERLQSHDSCESLYEICVGNRVNIRIADLYFSRAQQVGLHLGIIEIWMVEADWL